MNERLFDWVVSSEESGLKLTVFLSHRLEGKYSLRLLKKGIEKNCCEINGQTERFASSLVGRGDRIRFHIKEAGEDSLNLVDVSRIIYEDDSLLVYNKPAGINSDEQGILRTLKQRVPFLELIHRLDRETTGVLLFAKSQHVFKDFVQQFKEKKVEKRYLAIVDGHVSHEEGIIENYLGKKKAFAGQTQWGSVGESQGIFACTHWKLLNSGHQASLLACFPKTGRTHQIRVHMAEMGHPILGDFQYGTHYQCPYRPFRTLLHAEELWCLHPLTKQKLCLKASLPEDFKIAQELLFRN